MKKLRIYEIVEHDDIQTAQDRPDRLAFLNFLFSLREESVPVEQYNLINHPMEFLTNEAVAQVLDEEGDSAFPLIYINEDLVWRANYPSVEEMADKLDVSDILSRLKTLPDAYFESACGPEGCAGCSGCGGMVFQD